LLLLSGCGCLQEARLLHGRQRRQSQCGHGGRRRSGVEWSGVEWSGVEWSGVEEVSIRMPW
jgi:hypothetical protein